MAQQPGKLRWKADCWYGLSASQFGMALGFSGRVCDFVDYLRNIVGTEQEFKGNSFTDHGIVTEPKARALYEVLTGSQVHDGGFFLAHGRLLGCSPDGQIFYYEDACAAPVLASSTVTPHSGATAAAGTHTSSTSSPRSPWLGDNAPWLVPRPPLTTGPDAQGQGMAVPATLSTPCVSRPASPLTLGVTTQCAVRIPFSKKRSRSSGPVADESGLNRSASSSFTAPTPLAEGFPDVRAASAPAPRLPTRRRRLLEIKSPYRALYDCKKKEYQPFGIPLHYMCQMQGQMAIADAEECDFFVYLDQPCQVEAWRVTRSRAFWAWAEPKLLSVVAWTRDGPPDWLDRTFGFEPFDFTTLTVEPLVFPFDISVGAPLADAQRFRFFHQYQSPHEPATTPLELAPTRRQASAAAQLAAAVVPCDAVRFLFCEASPSQCYSLESLADAVAAMTPSVGSEERAAVVDREVEKKELGRASVARTFSLTASAATVVVQLAGDTASWNTLQPTCAAPPVPPPATVTLHGPLDWERAEIDVSWGTERHPVRCFHQNFFAGLSVCAGSDDAEEAALLATAPSTPVPPDEDGDVRSSLLHRTPVKDAVPAGDSISQHVRLSLTPRTTTRCGSGTAPSFPPDGLEPKAIAEDDLFELLRFAEDCSDVWLLEGEDPMMPETIDGIDGLTARHHTRAVDVDQEEEDVSLLFTLVVGSGARLRRLVQVALQSSSPASSCVAPLLAQVRRACLAQRDAPHNSASSHSPGPSRVVLCYVENSTVTTAGQHVPDVFPPLPCFVVQTEVTSHVLTRCTTILSARK